MLSKIKSAALIGIEAIHIDVEVNCSLGLPGEHIVGLPDTVIRESRNRIKTAIKNSGFEYPNRCYTINLAPAEIPKEGSIFDLPIAVGILHATGQLSNIPPAYFVGELSLDGSIRPIKGILSLCELASKDKHKTIIIPESNIKEASLFKHSTTLAVKHLMDLKHIQKQKPIIFSTASSNKSKTHKIDYSDVKGQIIGKRAAEIAAAGRHNILFIGPPGSGKSMLLKRLPTIMPLLTEHEALENFKIKSITDHTQTVQFSNITPFRAPHHSISYAGMVGGGTKPKPGEISLAHNGILFLDELPEFNRQVLEVLRQPIENKTITISRASLSITFPANFMLVAAMNPCPCGYFGDIQKNCICSPSQVNRYQSKLSGPILDRFDLIIDIPRLSKKDFEASNCTTYQSDTIQKRVEEARETQYNRYNRFVTNGQLDAADIQKHFKIDKESVHLLADLVDKGHLTARSHDHILKIAQTICDLGQKSNISQSDILESLQYRKILDFKT